MPLDVALLGPDGAPTDVASMRASVHSRLIQLAQRQRASLLLRLSDFYRDAAYEPSELPALAMEVERLLLASPDDQEVHAFLVRACDLIQQAQSLGSSLNALAD